MAAPNTHVKVSSAWKQVNGLHVKVSGSWKAVQNAYVKVSGSWKLAYSAISYVLKLPTSTWQVHNSRLTSTGYCATGFRCRITGRLDKIDSTGGFTTAQTDTWIHESAIGSITGSDYEAAISSVSTTLSGGTQEENFPTEDGTYYGLGTERAVDLSRTTTGITSSTGTLTIREVAVPANSVTVNYSLEAQLTL